MIAIVSGSKYGKGITFCGDTLKMAINMMKFTLKKMGHDVSGEMVEGIDYEVEA